MQDASEVADRQVPDGAGAPVQNQQAGRTPLLGRELRHQVGGQVEREVGNLHGEKKGRSSV